MFMDFYRGMTNEFISIGLINENIRNQKNATIKSFHQLQKFGFISFCSMVLIYKILKSFEHNFV